ncbi:MULTISPECIES: rubredoxin [unclassified Sphingomonas]|uniref:rubredoxin n=1 Tax=unclassified Sphingomonas TaxID=196159 RepID=UPI00286B6A6E|nr:MULTISPECIES: rubredoxin [unclassified Sphingomonas]
MTTLTSSAGTGARWICLICGWIYDQRLGDPESGIAPGTSWDDIPDDWRCPECGVNKTDFNMVRL